MRFFITANNIKDLQGKESKPKDDSNDRAVSFSENEEYLESCPSVDQENTADCANLNYPCITCSFPSADCRYGVMDNYSCSVKARVVCNVSSVSDYILFAACYSKLSM